MATRPPVNEQLRDLAIAHSLLLERLKNSEQVAVARYVNDELIPELTTRLEARLGLIVERGVDIGPDATRRLELLIASMKDMLEAWTSRYGADLIARVGEFAQLDARWTTATINEQVSRVSVQASTTLPALEQLAVAALARPIDGVLIQGWLDKLDATAKANVERAIRTGIATGEPTARIARRVRDATELSRDAATALTRTSIGHAANVGRDAAYEANADIIKGVGWSSTLDTRTCPRCGKLDGKVFAIGKGPRPVLHVSCRCSTYPVLKSWRAMGIDAKDIAPGDRASMDGQVPGSLTFGDWLKRRNEAEQVDVLGKTRTKLFRSGALEIGDFVNRSNELMTLDDLRTRYAAAFKRAGI